MEAYLEVIFADGTSERFPFSGDQTFVGKAPRGGIFLPAVNELENEHMLVVPRAEGCWVSVARGARTPAIYKGKPLEAGIVPWGEELSVGPLRLRFSDRPFVVAKKQSFGLTGIISAAVLVPLAAWLLLADPKPASIPIKKVQPPSLFEEQTSCGDTGPGAELRAVDSAEAGFAKAERYPFAPRDGLQAVGYFSLAAACYRAVGKEDEARRMDLERDALRGRIEEDFLTRKLRLERSLQGRHLADALEQARVLLVYLDGRSDPYTAWLVQLERTLRLRVEASARAKKE